MSKAASAARPGPVRPGAANSLQDVSGIRVGHAQRAGDGWLTGVTVVLTGPAGMTGGVDVRGGAPGTRETDLLDPRNLVERVHAVVLTGGSAYGLAAADGVLTRLADAGVGHPVGADPGQIVPIVPAAVIFDLGRGGSFRATPGPAMGAAAVDAAMAGHRRGPDEDPPLQGSIGAGTGAVAGGFAGGLGTASAVLSSGPTVGALAVVNAAGSPADSGTGELCGARFALPGEFGGLMAPDQAELAAWRPNAGGAVFNTTIGVLATDVVLTKAQCARLAGAGHDGLARAIRPAHTMVDGDAVFGLARGGAGAAGLGVFQELLGAAADAFARAMAHAILAAAGRPDAPSYRDVFPSAVRSLDD
ncbi:MAG TPA: P1 family peptidase [Streptosporangiaceae bacterium]|nr:P1 family peptidase [Streptosporangiaceae bacterium]